MNQTKWDAYDIACYNGNETAVMVRITKEYISENGNIVKQAVEYTEVNMEDGDESDI